MRPFALASTPTWRNHADSTEKASRTSRTNTTGSCTARPRGTTSGVIASAPRLGRKSSIWVRRDSYAAPMLLLTPIDQTPIGGTAALTGGRPRRPKAGTLRPPQGSEVYRDSYHVAILTVTYERTPGIAEWGEPRPGASARPSLADQTDCCRVDVRTPSDRLDHPSRLSRRLPSDL
mgnify:CR=1 FL=1